jgi:hypothetical protein
MRRVWCAVLAAVTVVLGQLVPVESAGARGLVSRLDAGQRWYFDTPEQASPSGRFQLFLDIPEGGFQLQEYLHLAQSPRGALTAADVWETTVPRLPFGGCLDHGYLAMQTDGNLVSYCRPGRPVWSSHTAGTGHHNYFKIQDNGNLVVYTADGRAVWASHSGRALITTGDRVRPGGSLRTKEQDHRFVRLRMQRGGDLVLTYGTRVAWHSDTHVPGSMLKLLKGGNLIVVGPKGRLLWSTHTAGVGRGTSLVVLDDGKIAEARLVGPHGRQLWSRTG